MKYQSSHKLKYKLPLIASIKEKQVTTPAEDVKTSDETTKEMTRQTFNEVLKQEDCTPETWRIIRIKVINVEEVGNYRPICTLPALHNLFTTTKKKHRLYSRLDQTQSEYQGGFRRSDQTLDHLATYGLLEQKCWEWSIEMWVAAVHFMKAFDSTRHHSFWRALEKCGIESRYISFLKRLHAAQKGTFSTDREIDVFELKEWTKGRFFVQFTLRHGAPNATERWCGALAKIKRHGDTIWWLWIWLPHNLACCWRRVPVLYFAGAAPKSDVRLHSEYWECRIENPPGQDDNSEQPKCKQKKRSRNNNIKVEILSAGESAKYLDKELHFSNRKKQRSKIEPERLGHLSTDTHKSWHQDHTSYNTDSAYSTRWSRRCWATLWHLDTIKGTWKNDTIDSTQNASLHRPNKEKIQKENSAQQERRRWRRQKTNHRSSDEETAEGISSNTDCDQDSHISFMNDTDEDIDTSEIEEEDWVEYMKCSTAVAVEWMTAAKIPCWIEMHTEEWNGAWQWDLHRYQMNDGQRKQQHGTTASAPKSRHADLWEYFKQMWRRNQWLKREETEETKGNEIKSNDTWIKVAKNWERWKAMESEYATTAAAVSVDSVQSRRNPPQDPVRHARYLNGVKLDEHEVANITEPHTKDQTDFDWYSGRHRLWTGTRNQTPKNWCLEGLMSSNHIDDRVCRTFPWDLCSLCQMNPWIQQPCSSSQFFLEHLRIHVFLNSIEFVTANACWSFHARLCTLSWTEYQESSLPVEQEVQTYQILFCVGPWPQHSCPRRYWRMRSEDPLRRGETLKGDKHQLSKRIKACIRHRERTKRQEKIQRILEEFRGIKSFSCTTSGRKRTVVPKVKNDKGETITSRKGIANVFGPFYSKLFSENRLGEEVPDPQNLETRMNTEQKSYHEDLRNEIPEFTQVEIQAAINSFNKGEASDNSGRRRQDKRRNDTRNDQTDLQRSVEAGGGLAHQKHEG